MIGFIAIKSACAARSLLVSLLFYAQLHGFANIKTDIIVNDCVHGERIFHTHFYKYLPNGEGIEFVQDGDLKDLDFEIINIKISDEGSPTFYLTPPELELKD